MCIDYHQLNQRTAKDSYALPRIEEILDSLSGATLFSVMDMKSGYYQVEIEEVHKCKTAFTVGPLGFFKFNRMPFGITNAPATYQRLMEQCLGELHMVDCFIYLDDVIIIVNRFDTAKVGKLPIIIIIIFSTTFEEHLQKLSRVLQRLREHGIKRSPKKCSFIQERVKYLGFVVLSNGIEADPVKVEKIIKWE